MIQKKNCLNSGVQEIKKEITKIINSRNSGWLELINKKHKYIKQRKKHTQ